MAIDKFVASVQYDDFKGTSAADRADKNGLENWLTEKKYKKPDEFLLGIDIYIGENHGKHTDPIYVDFLLTSLGGHDSVKAMIDSTRGPIEVRKVPVEMDLYEFFSLFKRFSVALSSSGMLDGRDFTYAE